MNDQAVQQSNTAVKILSTLALQMVLQEILPPSELKNIDFAPTQLLLQRLNAGESADAIIVTKEGAEQLAANGIVHRDYRDIAISSVGIAQAQGSEPLDITTVDKFRSVLLGVQSIAYSASGASGIFFADLLEKLGIAETVKDKSIVISSGFTGELVASGHAEIAIQQMSELHTVRGLGKITPLPPEAQCLTVFSAATLTKSANPDALNSILSLLKSDRGRHAIQSSGLSQLS